ncbi:MAG: hypothetical protein WAU70_16575 [Flavobacteriales bacterium]
MNTPLNGQQLEKQRIALLSVLMFLFMLLLAFIPGLKAVHGLTWGASVDFHRDASFARAIVEGHYGEDPIYLGGSLWFTPMVAWMEAIAVWLTGHPVDQVIVQMGAYTNLLAPIAFFIMAWYFFGPVRAVVCASVFLFFMIGQEPGWASPTYSPRLIPVSFCQWFFYIEVILIDRAFRSTRLWPSIVAGTGAGVTFLAHAGPALLSVLIIFLFTLREVVLAIHRKDGTYGWPRFRASLAAGAAFILCSLPLTWYVVGEYGMHVVNRTYFRYTYYALTIRERDIFLYHNISLINGIALAGLWLVFRKRVADTTGRLAMGRGILLTWFTIATVLTVYSYSVAFLEDHYGMQLPGILPAFHFFFYVKSALIVCAGLAVWQGFLWLRKRLGPTFAAGDPALHRASVLCFFTLIALACLLDYPSYATRRDVFSVRNRNLAFMERTNDGAACIKVNETLPWDAVILCDRETSIWPLLPSARKVVATVPNMGNPYLDQSHRDRDRDLLLLGMLAPREDTQRLLDTFTVTHFLTETSDLPLWKEASRWFPKEVYHDGDYVLLAR